MASPKYADTQMVTRVNPRLRRWWENMKRDHAREVARLVGGLTFLIYVIPDPYMVQALLEFWKPEGAVFKFQYLEMTPTLEEIGGFTDLNYYGSKMIVPHSQSPNSFLRSLGLNYNPRLASLSFEWISFGFLYSRFGHQYGFQNFREEFFCSAQEWKRYRVKAFAIALLGTLVFPKEGGRIDTRLSYVVHVLDRSINNFNVTLVPMILAEMMRALTKCVRGEKFFGGCNLLLQIWAIEHFHEHGNFDRLRNKIHTHPQRMSAFNAPVGYEGWLTFMKRLSGVNFQWKYSWLDIQHARVKGEELSYIELIGLKGVQPYAPLRVVRQFGQLQDVPFPTDMSISEYDFDSWTLEVRGIMERWERVITVSLHKDFPFCTRRYIRWILKDDDDTDSEIDEGPGIRIGFAIH